MQIPSYQGKEWVGRRKLQKNMPELTVWEFIAYVGAEKVTMVCASSAFSLGSRDKVKVILEDMSVACSLGVDWGWGGGIHVV